MKMKGSNTLIASATGVGSVGAAFFGLPGAIVGLILGLGLGYWSESDSQRINRENKPQQQYKAQA